MSAFRVTVDPEFNKKHNEMFRDTRRLKISAVSIGVILIGAAIALIVVSHHAPWSYAAAVGIGVTALISFAMVPIISRHVGSAQSVYDTYELVPSVIARVNPRDIVIVALVNTTVDPHARAAWGLATRTITGLPHHERREGERVPAMAVSGRRTLSDQDHWSEISPMPVAWATPNSEIIEDAIHAIPAAQWKRLERLAGRVDEVLETPYNLLRL